jgi:cbb3-type cytochrome oxidase subunit 3
MIQNVIRALGGIDHYGVLSLLIFGAVFIGVLVWAATQRKAHLDHMARVPLELEPEDSPLSRNSTQPAEAGTPYRRS